MPWAEIVVKIGAVAPRSVFGRKHESDLIVRLLDEIESHGGALVVEGEAGIGKSTLFHRNSIEVRRNLSARMSDHRHLDELLRAQDGDAGCSAGEEILDAYVDLELAGEDPARVYPGTAIHLQSCPACQADYRGLLEAARRIADVGPE